MTERCWFDPLAYREFGLLTAQTKYNLDQVRSRKQYVPLLDPPRRGDGLWIDSLFLPADTVPFGGMETLRQQGLSRDAMKAALPDIKACCVSVFNALDDGREAWLALTHDGWRYITTCAPSPGEALSFSVDRFAELGQTDITGLRFFCAPLHEALILVRMRAAAMDIPFPKRIWPSLNELDVGAELLARRRSPVAEQWIAARRAEVEATALRDEGRLA